MDFSYTSAQEDLSSLAREVLLRWSNANPAPDAAGFDRALWASMAQAGLLEAALPESAGGTGFGLLEQCSILVEIGRTVAPVPYLSSIATSAAIVAELGNHDQIQRWVLPVLRGQAIIAPALGGEFISFSATRIATGWRLNGSLGVVPGGTYASAYLVAAQSDEGVVLAVLDCDSPGVDIAQQHTVDGTDAVLLTLTDAPIQVDALVGQPGDGGADWAKRRATIAWTAYQLGITERMLELTAEYAQQRKQFGKRIGSFQAVRQRLADAYIDVEAIRLALWQAACLESKEPGADAEVAIAKFWAAEAGHRVAHTAVHVHASIGIYLDFPVQAYFVAAKRAEFALGGAGVQLRRLGTLMAAEL